ncbi:MAG: DEAD/DEAH box helicase [Actinomycetota bacterium]|nr:DEAD/DEAH box helicase [Actinomycetota bacterium]
MNTELAAQAFRILVAQATSTQDEPGLLPYDYQVRLALDGLSGVLDVPTGSGKTMGAGLSWVFRRRYHPDPDVRRSTPRRLVYVLPLRSLVEQTTKLMKRWLEALGVDPEEVPVVTLMGGDTIYDGKWRLRPESDAVLVGTQDQILSRVLMRGYGTSRFSWAIDSGLLNNDCAYVFDELQLMGPALPTARQLDGLRQRLGVSADCTSLYMSATVNEAALSTVDNPDIERRIELSEADREGLARRLGTTRLVRRVPAVVPGPGYADVLAAHVAARHRPGTRSLVVLNTVRSARAVRRSLDGRTDAALVLLHSRFRPGDRGARAEQATARVDPTGPGVIVVSTQVLEAGVDVSSSVLTTEAAPWSSVVQRAGRLNRAGEVEDAELWWCPPEKATPYDDADVAATVDALDDLEGRAVTSRDLRGRVPDRVILHPVLRRRDLVDLFDTSPDISGNDLDVSRFIRDADDTDVSVFWRPLDGQPGSQIGSAAANELCPVPVADLRAELRRDRRAWTFDHLDAAWRPLFGDGLRPGLTVLLDAGQGGYDPALGWDPQSRAPVPLVETPAPVDEQSATAEALAAETGTFHVGRWVSLAQHLDDAEAEACAILGALGDALPGAHREAVAVAARLHDLGKAHGVFQDMLLSTATDEERPRLDSGQWAKSARAAGLGYPPDRRYFRHELVTALALLDGAGKFLHGVEEPDLVVYLAAAHHGRVRLGARSLDRERDSVLGVRDGDVLPPVTLPFGTLPEIQLSLQPVRIGGADGEASYTARALALRDRGDLGPFRLAYLEAIVRMADWRASADPGRGGTR